MNHTQLTSLAGLTLATWLSACQCAGVTIHSDAGVHGDAGPGGDAGPRPDAGVWDGGFPTDGGFLSCQQSGVCPIGLVCRLDHCIIPPTACTSNGQCEGDRTCLGDECVPFGVSPLPDHDPTCQRLGFAPLFLPQVQCEWTGPPPGDPYPDHRNVLVTPLVVDFRFDGGQPGELGSVHPSIVFTTYNCDDGLNGQATGCFGVIRVIDGQSCAQQFSVASPTAPMIGSATPAIGDLNGDGRPDIVAERIEGGVVGFQFVPGAPAGFVELWTTYSSVNTLNGHWDSLALHDLDDDGVPEIVQCGPQPAVYDHLGQLVDQSTVDTSYAFQLHPVLADLDGDGSVEMVDGAHVFRFDKGTRKWATLTTTGQPLGQVGLADFGTYPESPGADVRGTKDGIPEVVVVSMGEVRIQTRGGRVVFGPMPLPASSPTGTPGVGGAPTIGDFDGDGRVEFAVAGAEAYTVFDPDCVAGQGASALCPSTRSPVPSTGVLWSRNSQDASSNMTGSSVFDFNGDGSAEVVYADECFSRVYDGKSGEVLFSQFHTSCTWYENPVVADVDGDLRAEVVIPSNVNCAVTCPAVDPIHDGLRCDTDVDCPATTTCTREAPGDAYGRCRCSSTSQCGSPGLSCVDPLAGPSSKGKVCRATHPAGAPQHGILVLHDGADRWVSSRTLWNQHAYAVTNVNDDGTIPRTSAWKQNWKDPTLNNFRMNVQGKLAAGQVPDLTAQDMGLALLCPALGPATLRANVCNRGTAPVAPGLPVTFYDEGLTPLGVLCTGTTANFLFVGQCEAVTCTLAATPNGTLNVRVVADDDGTGQGRASECEEGNNLAHGTVVCSDIN